MAEGQINMTKVYFHGEMTMLCTQPNVSNLHYILI